MVSSSFKNESQIWMNDIQWIPQPVTLENYQMVFDKMPFFRYFANSVAIASIVTLSQVIVAYMAGYAFAKINFKGRDTIFMVFLATMMIPSYILILPLYLIIDKLGLMDTYAAIVVPSLVSAFSIYLMRSFMYNIPKDLDEAAMIDGCNRLTALFRVNVPLTLPALSSMIIFVFMGSWNNFLWPLLVVSKTEMRTIPLALTYFQQANRTQYGALMAAAVLSSLPILIVFLFAQKKFIEGMTMSGVKG